MSITRDITALIRNFEDCVVAHTGNPDEHNAACLGQARNELITAVKALDSATLELATLSAYAKEMTQLANSYRERNAFLEKKEWESTLTEPVRQTELQM